MKPRKIKNQRLINQVFYWLTFLCALTVSLIFAGILLCLIQGSIPAIKAFGWHFVITSTWDPVLHQFGAASAILGTLITSCIALFIAVPISFGINIFLLKIAPYWMRKMLRVTLDLLAGIPSIIYGMWGLFSVSPIIGKYVHPFLINKLGSFPFIGNLFRGPQIGIGLFTAGLILGIMVIPFISSTMHDVFDLTPQILQESAYALGATAWETIWKIIVPFGRLGIIGSIMLGLGRALGETMAVAFVIGNAHTLTTALFMPANSITSTLANEFTEATGKIYSSALIELGLYLFLITTTVILLSRILLHVAGKQAVGEYY